MRFHLNPVRKCAFGAKFFVRKTRHDVELVCGNRSGGRARWRIVRSVEKNEKKKK